MKRLLLTISKGILCISILTAATSFFTGCGGDSPPPTPAEIMTKQLVSNGWKISSVQVDGIDQTALFANMTLSFNATSYTTTKGGQVWPSSGSWSFTDDTAKTIKRSDNVDIVIMEVTDTSLKLSLDWATGTLGPGRTSSVSGKHVFAFGKQ